MKTMSIIDGPDHGPLKTRPFSGTFREAVYEISKSSQDISRIKIVDGEKDSIREIGFCHYCERLRDVSDDGHPYKHANQCHRCAEAVFDSWCEDRYSIDGAA